MRIAVFGLGYVGCVTGACLARMGHTVCGIDVSPQKVRLINEGKSPVLGKGIARLVSRVVRADRLRAHLRAAEGMENARVSMIAVGTPSRNDGGANLEHVRAAAAEIGRALRSAKLFHTVVLRSTVPPGTTEKVLIPALEESAGMKAGRDFGVCFLPEFLREGSAVHDFLYPPKIVIGAYEPRGASVLKRLWKPIRAPLFVTSLKAAEMVKYADNGFHALKVSFANEVGALCKRLGIDSHEVMRIFIRDTKLNISPLYLKPGFAFGGPCLPKDLRALCSMARNGGVKTPLLSSILVSNSSHLRRAVELILATKKRRIGVLGLAFKSATDDLRESPACALVESLLRAKREVRVYEPRLEPSRLLGANRAFVEKELPQLPSLLTSSLGQILSFGEVIVVAGVRPEFAAGLGSLKRNQVLIELTRLPWPNRRSGARSEGLCW